MGTDEHEWEREKPAIVFIRDHSCQFVDDPLFLGGTRLRGALLWRTYRYDPAGSWANPTLG
jgi:hypothetical protein